MSKRRGFVWLSGPWKCYWGKRVSNTIVEQGKSARQVTQGLVYLYIKQSYIDVLKDNLLQLGVPKDTVIAL